MKLVRIHLNRRQRQRAMTLIEILIASALLMVLTLGLTLMFNQTQRAFRTGLKNADVYEGARATLDLMARDLEQAKKNPFPSTNLHSVDIPSGVATPIAEFLQDGGTKLQEICFLTQISNRWIGVGYRLGSPFLQGGVGELYRYTTNYGSSYDAVNLVRDFDNTPLNSDRFRRVGDGIVHLRFMPFSTNGYNAYDYNANLNINSFPQGTYIGLNTNFFDFSNSVPGYVQIEVAMLESPYLEQMKAMPDRNSQVDYLIRNAHKAHMFRQQVPIRSANR